ncbi:hypothetical protein [Pseudomonas phage D6]|nr:hypothetical protein [Pseudomonas phage D6]
MLQPKQIVKLSARLAIKARRGRSVIVLGEAGDTFRVIKPHETLTGYYYMRGFNVDCPPMSVIHFTEVVA